jgi:hypothetical protein
MKVVTKQRDVLDTVFEWTEKFLCSTPKKHDEMRNMAEHKEDMLDYVFEHTESLVCHQEGDDPYLLEEGQEHEHEDHYLQPYLLEEGIEHLDHDLRRDNSLIEPGGQIMATTSPTTNATSLLQPIKSIGEKGDFIDYVFEHVESLVCVDTTELENAPQAGNLEVDMRTAASHKRGEPAHIKRGERLFYTEQEDEIQVNFPRANSWSRHTACVDTTMLENAPQAGNIEVDMRTAAVHKRGES